MFFRRAIRLSRMAGAAHPADDPAGRDLTLVEAALSLHDCALGRVRAGAGNSVVAPGLIVLTGSPADRAQAEPSGLELALTPGPQSGWRSESIGRSDSSGTVQVEIVTATSAAPKQNVMFLHSPLHCDTRPAHANTGGRHAARTAALYRLGEIDRDYSDRQPLEMGRIVGLGMSDPHASANASALAALWTLLTAAEAEVRLHPRFPPAPYLRRLHVFAEIEKGMACAILTEHFRGSAQSPATQSIRSSIRRVPDGATLAVFETVLR